MRHVAAGSAAAAGLYLAVSQVGYFVHMEFMLSSTFVACYGVIGIWLLGALAGLFIRAEGIGAALLLGGLGAYYLHWAILVRFPFSLEMLPILLLLIFGSALYGGYFFRMARAQFSSARALLFHENNGFLLGYAMAVLQLLAHGLDTQLVLPAGAALLHGVLQYGMGPRRLIPHVS